MREEVHRIIFSSCVKLKQTLEKQENDHGWNLIPVVVVLLWYLPQTSFISIRNNTEQMRPDTALRQIAIIFKNFIELWCLWKVTNISKPYVITIICYISYAIMIMCLGMTNSFWWDLFIKANGLNNPNFLFSGKIFFAFQFYGTK